MMGLAMFASLSPCLAENEAQEKAKNTKKPNVPVELNGDNIVYYYEVNAEIPTPKVDLASIVSKDYQRARDEFTRHELFEKLKPVIEKRITAAKSNSRVIVKVDIQLPDYDFARQGFPTSLGSNPVVTFRNPYRSGYGAILEQQDKISFLPVSKALAKQLSVRLRRSRQCVVTIYGDVVKSQVMNGKKIVTVRPKKLHMALKAGNIVGKLDLTK